jgi:hypothetical protein
MPCYVRPGQRSSEPGLHLVGDMDGWKGSYGSKCTATCRTKGFSTSANLNRNPQSDKSQRKMDILNLH